MWVEIFLKGHFGTISWAVCKGPWLVVWYRGWNFLPNLFWGITRSQYENPYKPISVSWFMSAKGLFHAAQFPFKKDKKAQKNYVWLSSPKSIGSVFFQMIVPFLYQCLVCFSAYKKCPVLVFGGFFKVILLVAQWLGGGFKHFLFPPLPGEMIQID